ncbi:MAG: ferrous iron transport protein B [Bacteroidetes bacterium 4572_77]|nr:MAG: ferrous iron transport protein B [Bacteroidetes bacterium 4572_77]
MKTLYDLQQGESAIIVKVRGRGAFRNRIIEMGFVVGKKVSTIKKAPLKDPIEYAIMGYDISLRRQEAELIDVMMEDEPGRIKIPSYFGMTEGNGQKKGFIRKDKIINVALVGNPNSGKTSLYNFASHSKEHVGNYSGVTVDAKEAHFYQSGYQFNVVDLPGTYSITHYTPEELYVRNYIFKEIPDVVINVLDSSNLERNLYLSTQLIDMDIKVVIALNMYDELEAKGDFFDYSSLGKMIGIPMVPTVGFKGKGIKELFQTVIDVYEDKNPTVRHIHINYGKALEFSISQIQSAIKQPENYHLTNLISSRFLAIKLLENDQQSVDRIAELHNAQDILKIKQEQQQQLQKDLKEEPETIVADARYAFIGGALKETLTPGRSKKWESINIIDTFLLNKIFAFPIFLAFMWLMFYSTFYIGQYPMEWIEIGVGWLGDFLSTNMSNGILKDLLVDGIIGGVGGVVVFLPNILILFFFISFMEDTGYMARVAFIMDKIMHNMGLHGRSFIPLLMGFGCNVPAIMATRTIENRNDRLLTMLINPFMSCSARLPVYLVIIGAFFPDNPGSMLFTIYGIGIATAVLVAILFKKTIFKSKESPFVMELPPYRIPTFRNSLKHMWYKGKQYINKMGGIILIASIIIWALSYFPREIDFSKDYEVLINQEQAQIKPQNSSIENAQIENVIAHYQREKAAELQENSYLGLMGKSLQPVMQPLGFDWKMTVSLIAGASAKEIVVSTLGVLYQTDSDSENSSLQQRLQEEVYISGDRKGEKVFDPIVAFAFLIFVLIYFPCIATVAAVKKESGSWKWAAFMMIYTTGLAWIMAFLVNTIGHLIF